MLALRNAPRVIGIGNRVPTMDGSLLPADTGPEDTLEGGGMAIAGGRAEVDEDGKVLTEELLSDLPAATRLFLLSMGFSEARDSDLDGGNGISSAILTSSSEISLVGHSSPSSSCS